ncbi:hypothetical protein KCMC57_up21400 [Kitasatospora sp. CMC57]|uniref:Uncharacterized protein n=1 Tax=Kitasatospora sp. CMC57 TaxID=3231513 RepID=A0AB33JZ11_9ACTN
MWDSQGYKRTHAGYTDLTGEHPGGDRPAAPTCRFITQPQPPAPWDRPWFRAPPAGTRTHLHAHSCRVRGAQSERSLR